MYEIVKILGKGGIISPTSDWDRPGAATSSSPLGDSLWFKGSQGNQDVNPNLPASVPEVTGKTELLTMETTTSKNKFSNHTNWQFGPEIFSGSDMCV